MTEYLGEYLSRHGLLVFGTILTLILAVRWYARRMRATWAEHHAYMRDLFEKAKPAPEPDPPAEDDPDADPLDGYDGPITVDAGELRQLIRAAVREALAGQPGPAAPVLPPPRPAGV